MKVLQLLKAAVTRRFSNGAACKRYRGHYKQIIEVLDDILVKKYIAEWNATDLPYLNQPLFFRLLS